VTSPRRIKLTLEFDGKPFAGWQRQAKRRSVQGEIESALMKVFHHPITLYGAGRTDAGVHALGMTAHFDTTTAIPARRLPIALPQFLPEEISVTAAEDVAPDFDARRDALLRWYRYQIMMTRKRHPLCSRAWFIYKPLNVPLMEKALAKLEGDHDFAGFRASTSSAKRTMLTMQETRLMQHGRDGELLTIDLKCQSFLQRMVRLVIGGIVGVGLGRISPAEFTAIRDTGIRPSTVRAAPPEGLCLMRAAYTEVESENILTDHPTAPSF